MSKHPLDLVEAFLRRFVIYPSEHALVAHVLWIAHTHLMDCWDTTPRLAFMSAERMSGKTRAAGNNQTAGAEWPCLSQRLACCVGETYQSGPRGWRAPDHYAR